MLEGMHLTAIGRATILLEPGEALDPSRADDYLVPLLDYLQKQKAERLLYDLKTLRVIDSEYYRWLSTIHALLALANIQMITVNMRPAVAYALSLTLTAPPPFACALDVHRATQRVL